MSAYYFAQNARWTDAFIGHIYWVRSSLQQSQVAKSESFCDGPSIWLFNEKHLATMHKKNKNRTYKFMKTIN